MQIRRRCRRYCLGRMIIYFLILFTLSSTVIFSYNFYLNIFSKQRINNYKLYLIDEYDLEDARIKSTKNIHLLHEDYFNTTNLACRYPKLAIDNLEVWKHLDPVTQSQPDCEKSTNWVYVDNGLLNSLLRKLNRKDLIFRNFSISSTSFTKTWTYCLCLSSYSSIKR
jgi:hypothetical protein